MKQTGAIRGYAEKLLLSKSLVIPGEKESFFVIDPVAAEVNVRL